MTPSGPSWAMRCKTGIVWFCAYVILIIEHLDQWRRVDVDPPYEILQHLGPAADLAGTWWCTMVVAQGNCPTANEGGQPPAAWRALESELQIRPASNLWLNPYWSQLGGSPNLVDMCWYCQNLIIHAVICSVYIIYRSRNIHNCIWSDQWPAWPLKSLFSLLDPGV